MKKIYIVYYGYDALRRRQGTAREIYNSLKRIRNKLDLIDSLEIYEQGEKIDLQSIYSKSEIDEIFGY